ncbi:MAG TPA: hypothetical protein VGR85_14415 [Candidatus Limnocylindria bacterium]|nr:hypothetical protein [Candidatus Limnocylindria bacterium]
MAKRCGFCSFRSEDDAAFAAHVASVHGFGAARRSGPAYSAPAAVAPGTVTYCYACGAANPSGGQICASCGGLLTLAASAHVFGRSYVLNQLAGLVAVGALDEEAAARVREAVLANAAGGPVRRTAPSTSDAAAVTDVALPVAVADTPERVYVEPEPPTPLEVVPAGPGLFSPERAPSLLLYVGAFLIVVSALIFVNVSGEQISDSAKLALMLVGTIAFIAAGLVCHRIPRVLEAGRTFLLIGALITPLDFAAYYVLIVHASPLTTPEMWILGSLVSAVLYAALAMTSFGRIYAYLFFVATLSALAAIDVRFDARDGWAFVPFALFAIGLEMADYVGPERLGTLSGPLSLPSRVLAAVAVVGGIASSVGPGPSRWALSAIVAVGLLYYAIRARAGVEWERWLVVVGPAALAMAVVYDVGGAAQTYGFVSAILAVSYGVAGDIAGLGTPVAMPAWISRRARVVSLFAVAGALLPASSYWRAPLVGALVNLAMAAFLGSIAALRARAVSSANGPSRTDLGGYVLAGAAALHLGVLFAALSFGVIKGGVAAFTGLAPRELAILFAPVAAALAIFTGLARARAAALEASLALTALVSATAVVAFAYNDPPLETLLAALASAGVVAAAVVSRRPRALWIAAAFGAAAVVGLDRWVVPPVEWRPLALAAISLALFVPAYLRLRTDDFGRVVREIGLAAAGLAVLVGLSEAAAHASRMTDAANWLATIPAFLVFGSLGAVEGLHRRSERGVLLATTCFLAAVLMVVARFKPDPLEAYAWPVAIYLAAVAWGIARFGSERLRISLLVPTQVASAVVLMGSSLSVMPARGDVGRAALVMGEALVVIRYAASRGSMPLATTALGFLALMLYRSSVAPLVLETVSAVFGAVAIALALAVPRWISWRLPPRWLEATELAGALMVLVPPLVRASSGASDALDHGVTVLAAGWLIAVLGVWGGRRALLSGALGALAVVGVLALRDAAQTELYVAAAGAALLALAFAIPRVLPRRLPIEFEWLTEVVAVGLILSGALVRTFRDGGDAPSRALAESLTLVALGVIAARPALTVAALATVGIEAAWIIANPRAREFHGIVAGAYLMAVALAALRYRRDRIHPLVLLAMETGGAFLFIVPTLVAGWGAAFFPETVMVFVEIFLVLGVGIVLRRRWLVAGALAALGLETIRGAIDVVNRLPNWALFGASGAILLAVGFVLLLKREAWNAWSRSVFNWWARL